MNKFSHIFRLFSPTGWMKWLVLSLVYCCASFSGAHAAPSIESLYLQYTKAQNPQKQKIDRQLQKLLIEEEYVEAEFFNEKKYEDYHDATILMGVSNYF